MSFLEFSGNEVKYSENRIKPADRSSNRKSANAQDATKTTLFAGELFEVVLLLLARRETLDLPPSRKSFSRRRLWDPKFIETANGRLVCPFAFSGVKRGARGAGGRRIESVK